MSNIIEERRWTERNGRSAIHSHQEGYHPDVESICHHSGRYLTKQETNPYFPFFLKIQNDFPRLPKLDAWYYQKASHSAEHVHWTWSKHAVKGLTYCIMGALIILLLYRNQQLSDFIGAGFWLIVFWLWLVVAFLIGVALFGYGLYLIFQRIELFYRDNPELGPVTPDFPVECNYEIQVQEVVEATLGNVATHPDILRQGKGEIRTTIFPVINFETFEQYKEAYQGHDIGHFVNAGTIGLEELEGIQFTSEVEFDHRLVLKAPSSFLEYDNKKDNYVPFSLETAYDIDEQFLIPLKDGLPQFPISCVPSISHHDSRRLELRFRFSFPKNQYPNEMQVILQECLLTEISEDYLVPVTFVENGRFDTETNTAIWRNLHFERVEPSIESNDQSWELRVGISFEYPILNCPEHILGTYEIKINNQISQLSIKNENIWTAWGGRIGQDDCLIRRKSFFSGDLQIDPQLLAQKHEHITDVETIICKRTPDEHLVRDVLHVLQEAQFEIQRISKAQPRLHPTGRLDAQLQYWDIAGRSYNEQTLEVIELHLIIAGYQDISSLSTKQTIDPKSKIDLRLRCLHDPRNHITPKQADALGGTLTANTDEANPVEAAIPPLLRNHLREVLINSGPFHSHRSLRDIFIDKRISSWQDTLPEANSISDRADITIEYLKRQNQSQKNGLLSLLEVLRDRVEENDGRHHQLSNLCNELASYLNSPSNKQPVDVVFLQNQKFGLVNRLQQLKDCCEPDED